jgi:hypothetical protein
MHNLTLTLNVHTILGFAVYAVLATIILFVTQFVYALADSSLRGSSEVFAGLILKMLERWRESIVAAVIVAIIGLLHMPVLYLLLITIVCGVLLSAVPKSGTFPD